MAEHHRLPVRWQLPKFYREIPVTHVYIHKSMGYSTASQNKYVFRGGVCHMSATFTLAGVLHGLYQLASFIGLTLQAALLTMPFLIGWRPYTNNLEV